jgi:hypothetical protein
MNNMFGLAVVETADAAPSNTVKEIKIGRMGRILLLESYLFAPPRYSTLMSEANRFYLGGGLL